jgi:SnoaL-like polyketide cyclase
MFAAFPDFEFDAERIVADDRHAVLQWKASGTFTGGPFQGVEPTGRRVVNRGVDVMEVEDGLLRRITIYYDGLGVARAMGLLPPKGSFFERAMLFLVSLKSKLRRFFRRLFNRGR